MNFRTNLPGASDFDFVIGDWQVQHRQLKSRLTGCTEWLEFEGYSRTHKILGGLGNLEDNILEKPDGSYRAAALRSFDVQKGCWSIWWLDGRSPRAMEPPVVGGFVDGIGNFYCDDVLDGRPIKVRLTWISRDAERPHWEQAFSADGGETWETNWLMEFSRAA